MNRVHESSTQGLGQVSLVSFARKATGTWEVELMQVMLATLLVFASRIAVKVSFAAALPAGWMEPMGSAPLTSGNSMHSTRTAPGIERRLRMRGRRLLVIVQERNPTVIDCIV